MSIAAIVSDAVLLRWLFIASLISFFAVLIIVPWLIIRMPADYFSRPQRSSWSRRRQHPLIWLPSLIIKNLAAIVCLLIGIAMLLLPGQGIVTIMVGVLLLDFPGKYRTERWMISRGWIFRLFNHLRRVAKQPPFVL